MMQRLPRRLWCFPQTLFPRTHGRAGSRPVDHCAGRGAVYVAESGFVTPLGNRMEGAGMRPDREVPLALGDPGAGVDTDLVVAEEWIRQRAQRFAEVR